MAPLQRQKAFLDVTPIITTVNGERHELGTVRYEIEEYWDETLPTHYQQWVTAPSVLDYRGFMRIEYVYRLTSANAPQPKVIEAVTAE